MSENNNSEYAPRGFVLALTPQQGVILLQFESKEEMIDLANYLTRTQTKVVQLTDFNFTIKEKFTPGDVFKTAEKAIPEVYCKFHPITRMRPSKKPGVLFCPHQLPNGSYCKHTVSY